MTVYVYVKLVMYAGTMRRDYYRGSQDNLAERAALYRGTLGLIFLILFLFLI